MKNILKKLYVFIFILPLLFVGCKNNNVEKVDNSKEAVTPLFYKISKKDSNVNVYLLGSIHAAQDNIYPLNDTIMKAYKNSDYLAVEVDTVSLTNNLNLQLELTSKLLYDDNTTIKDELGDELYDKMINFLKEKNSYVSLYDSYRPAFFESLFENIVIEDADMEPTEGIDMHFLNLAKDDKKEILEIETAESQYNLLLSNPIELDKMMIDEYVSEYDEAVLEMKNLYNSWKSGDIKKLEKAFAIDDSLTEDEAKLIIDYNKALITDRNYIMSKALEEYISEDKNVFCVVGVGHLIGDEGIISLMEKNGYIVEKIEFK